MLRFALAPELGGGGRLQHGGGWAGCAHLQKQEFCLLQGPWKGGRGYTGACTCTLSGRNRFSKGVWPQAGEEPRPTPGVGPAELGTRREPSQAPLLSCRMKAFLMLCAPRTVTVLLGSLS